MYLGSGLYVVLLSVIIGVPLNSILAGRIFPMFVSDSNAGIPCHIAVYLYFLCIVVITVSYLISNAVLMKKLNKMSYSEILRDRD